MQMCFSKISNPPTPRRPPMLTKSKTSKRVIVYLSVSPKAIIAILVQELDSEMGSVYFFSQVVGVSISIDGKSCLGTGQCRPTPLTILPEARDYCPDQLSNC